MPAQSFGHRYKLVTDWIASEERGPPGLRDQERETLKKQDKVRACCGSNLIPASLQRLGR